ncbi:SpoIIE family protein phosphatase [Streptomyces mirabilis]
MHAATAVLDSTGTIVAWSQAAQSLLGYLASDVLGKPAVTMVAPLDATRLGDPFDAAAWNGPVYLRHSDGSVHRTLVQMSPLKRAKAPDSWSVVAVGTEPSSWQQVNETVFEQIFTDLPLGAAVLDTDLRYVWVNPTLDKFSGVSAAMRRGRSLEAAFPAAQARVLKEILRGVLTSGTPVVDYEYRGPTAPYPGGEQTYSGSAFRLEDPTGRVTGVCYLVLDVTERRRAQQRLALLSGVGENLGCTVDVMGAAQALADLAVPALADFVSVDLLDPVLHGEMPEEESASGRVLARRAGRKSSHSGCLDSIPAVGDRIEIDIHASSPTGRALGLAEPLLEAVIELSTSEWVAEAPDHADIVRAYGLHSVIVVPLCVDGVALGVVTYGRWRTNRQFTEADLRFVQEFTARAGPPLDRIRSFTRDHTIAVTLQRALLPQQLEGGTSVDLAWRYLPAGLREGVGGDWCDVIPLSGRRVALVVGDMVGHGIHVAAAMGRLRTAVNTLADMDLPPDEVLAHLDDLVLRLTEPAEAEGPLPQAEQTLALASLGSSCLYAVYDPVARLCTVARAGHPPPGVLTPDGVVTFPDLPAGPPLGLGGAPFESAELVLPEGSVLALYTDGLIDHCDRDIDAGMAQLAASLATGTDDALGTLCERVFHTVLRTPPRDDAVLLLARTRVLPDDRVASWSLAADPAVVADARQLASTRLADWGVEDLRFSTELIVSELVTNAMRHGAVPIRLRLILDDVLICEVSDGSSTSPRLRHARTTDEGGRGLHLVAQFSRRWGARHTGSGKVIWAEQSLPGACPPIDTGSVVL